MALLSFFVCAFVLVFALRRDYGFIRRLLWAVGGIDFNNTELQRLWMAAPIEFHIGMLTYAHRGDPEPEIFPGSRCVRWMNMQIFEYDTNCVSATQNYTFFSSTIVIGGNACPNGLSCAEFNFTRANTWMSIDSSLNLVRPYSPRANVAFYTDSTCTDSTSAWRTRGNLCSTSACPNQTTGVCSVNETCASSVDAVWPTFCANTETCASASGTAALQISSNLDDCQAASITINGVPYDFSYKFQGDDCCCCAVCVYWRGCVFAGIVRPSGYALLAKNDGLFMNHDGFTLGRAVQRW